MRHRSYANLSFHDRNRAEEVLCALARLTAQSTSLPRADTVSFEVGFDASEVLFYLASKKLVNAYGPVKDSWYSLSPLGERAVEKYCRRAA